VQDPYQEGGLGEEAEEVGSCWLRVVQVVGWMANEVTPDGLL